MQQQQRRLNNGLRVELISDPQATRASALFQVDVGSHHEPDAWPGLAHLLEHLLFAGSQAFQDQQRLMAWLPAQGGRLNATTLGSSTACFFECAPEILADALARLTDMLVAPLLAEQAIRQEVATIDAECRLLADHQDTLCDAALSAAFRPHPWQRFLTGNAEVFGNDTAALRAALQQFHQRYYHAGNITLWVQGPQSMDALWQLARQAGAAFPSGGVPPLPLPALIPDSSCDLALQLGGAPRLRLSFLLDRPGGLALLRQLLLDEAQGSLMAALREQEWCDDIRLLLPYRSAQQTVISIELVLVDAREAERAEALVQHWLMQLAAITAGQRAHYAQLARRQFFRLTVMDQLRERAFGFAPEQDREESGGLWFAQLSAAPVMRLWITNSQLAGRVQVQGLSLACQPQTRRVVQADAAGAVLSFFPQPHSHTLPLLPLRQAALAHHRPDEESSVLLLSPAGELPAPWGQILHIRLRALAAACIHQGGELVVSCQQGRWLIQLQGEAALMVSTLASINDLLGDISPAVIARGKRDYQRQQQVRHDDIAIRALLNALPEQLLSAHYPTAQAHPLTQPWCAVLEGGNHLLHQQLSCLLSDFPAAIAPAARTMPQPLPPPLHAVVATRSQESALLRFCPLVEESAACLAAWQLLAMIYQPLFFQRLRVELNIGYVVSCRFYQAAGQSGILFALQSPHLTTAQLSAHIDLFLAEIDATIATISAEIWWEKCQALLAEQHQMPAGVLEGSRHRWLLAQQNAPQPDLADLSALTPAVLWQYHQRLLADSQRAWHLVNHPCS
ncbi:pyrroloquinoline quinone biosynthesis protein PqqF [Erwinia sorbitola]|uniref:Coenzyme PQQ synthesis protein F n=1 Tax=Erwinia sorbitola TaxID=2681984 RepID=A0A6I6ES28_9GAMM|nr:pyrroloquinoline quinone biosynthesis protein PqqF [Erwinia sorbitola]QGU89046.1 pyrroloquinoline quinone biosynthesis protein PqqF [Erwinia sorbitola]